MSKRASFWGMIVVFFLTSFLTLHTDVSAAEKADPDLSEKVEQLEKEMNQLSAKNDSYDYLKEETKSYREFVEGEWDRFINLLQCVLPLVVTVIGATLIFFDVKSVKGIKKRADEKAEEIKKDVENTVQNQFEGRAEQAFEKVIGNEVTDLQDRIGELGELVDKEVWYKSSKILVLDRGNIRPLLSTSPLDKNLKIDYEAPPYHRLSQLLKLNEVDIIVYEYDLNAEDQRDSDLIKVLKQIKKDSDLPIPMVVYYPDRLNNEIKEYLDIYKWYVFANSPVTLFTNMYSLAHVFHSKKNQF
ncbi:hypothetical protein [Kroppenstedtia sanguinis]|uniref:hypothetical protein n=1 Tax=Kroppenstedtia sanguinis TaxID=1380684 RepID=UPI00039B14A2